MNDQQVINIDRLELIELIRTGYIKGMHDEQDRCAAWCMQGSAEIAEAILEEFEEAECEQ